MKAPRTPVSEPILKTMSPLVRERRIWEALRKARERFLPTKSVRGRYAGAVLWSFIGTVVSNAAGLILSIALARALGREGYGELGILLSTYGLFSQIGGLGLGVTAVKYAAQFRSTQPELVGRLAGTLLATALICYAITAVLVMVFAPELASLLNRPTLIGPLRLSSLLVIVLGLDAIQVGLLSGLEAFRKLARVTMIRAMVNFPLTLAGVYLMGLNGVILAMIISGCVTIAINKKVLNEVLRTAGIHLKYGFDHAQVKVLWKFSIPAFVAGSFTVISSWVLNAMLVNQPSGYVEMGAFNAANQWRALATLVPIVCNSVVLSIQANLYGGNERQTYHRSLVANLKAQCIAGAIVVGSLAAFSPWIMSPYGKEFKDSVTVLVLLAFGWFFLAPAWILWNAMISGDRIWWGVMFSGLGTTALILSAFALIPLGARGIALAYLVAGIFQVGLQGIYYYRWRRQDINLATLQRPIGE